MDYSETQLPRPSELITSDLEKLTAEPGFIYTFCLMVLEFLWMSPDQITAIDWYERPNNREMSVLLGFLVKHAVDSWNPPSEEIYNVQRKRTCSLLQELHLSYAFPPPNPGEGNHSTDPAWPAEVSHAYEEWINNGDGMVEPILYGGEGAYDFQYLEMADERYSLDHAWLEEHLGTSYGSIIQVAQRFKEMAGSRVRNLRHPYSFEDFSEQILSALSFSPADFPTDDRFAFETLVDKFALFPGSVNESFSPTKDRNVVDSQPVIDLGNQRYFLPLFANLAQAIYESPFYWMNRDHLYKDTAFRHRGETTERITRTLLSPVFKHGRIYRNVRVKSGTKDVTDIDVLAVSGNKAVIVQCKSKKLTAKARTGDADSLKNDFLKAVQEPYQQGLAARNVLLGENPSLTRNGGQPIQLRWPITDAYVVCVTGDHYPALLAQARAYLHIRDGDPYPVIMTIFDLDLACHYLADQFEFLYYLRQRSNNAEYYFADSEPSLLGFHLRHKLFRDPDTNMAWVSYEFGQLIDADFLATRGGWPKSKSANRLSNSWQSPEFDELVHDVKSVIRQPEPEMPAEDILFFLYDIAGQGADQLINAVNECKRLTKLDGERRDMRLLLDVSAGTTFVSFPEPNHPIQAELFRDEWLAIAMAHKYRSKADEWLLLASFENSPVSFELFGYMNERWEYDEEFEQVVDDVLVIGKSLGGKRKKVGRNRACPCGSGQKYKRCHGK